MTIVRSRQVILPHNPLLSTENYHIFSITEANKCHHVCCGERIRHGDEKAMPTMPKPTIKILDCNDNYGWKDYGRCAM
jgi:hypothetical protein